MFTILVPVHNKAEILENSINRLVNVLKKNFREQWQIFILDRGSTDNSDEVERKLSRNEKRVKIVSAKKRLGLGFVLKRNLDIVKGEVIIIEPELTEKLSPLRNMITELRNRIDGPDIVSCSRFLKESEYTSMFPRKMLSKFYNFLVNIIFRTKLTDFQCEFKGYKEDVFKHLCFAARSNHRFWLTESLVRAYKMDYFIKEVPVYYNKQWRVHLKNFILRIKNVLRLKKET